MILPEFRAGRFGRHTRHQSRDAWLKTVPASVSLQVRPRSAPVEPTRNLNFLYAGELRGAVGVKPVNRTLWRKQMAQTSTKPTDLNRAFEDARMQASGVAGAVSGAAQDVYGQARESAADVVDTAGTAARKTMSSFEKALRSTIETQPYTAAAIALGLGWLLGRMHRPL